MDGVLVDTLPAHYKAWKKSSRDYGIRYTHDDLFDFNGVTTIGTTKLLAKKHKVKGINYKKFAFEKDELVGPMLARSKMFPKTAEVLRFLKKKGYKLILVTAATRKVLHDTKKLKPVLKYFDGFIYAGDVKKSRPNPEMFLKSAKKAKAKPEECVVVDDAYLGVIGAKKAGFKVIGVSTYYPKKRLEKADVVVKEIKGINQKVIDRLEE